MSVFQGVCVAVTTPFTSGGVDFDAFGATLDFLAKGGVDAVCVCGTTGEPSTMTETEKKSVIEYTVRRFKGKIPVIAGAGCNDTAAAAANAKAAEALGADAVLVVTPYYNKCTQAGLVAHYSAVADAVNIPVIAYNVPSRTGVNILPSTAVKLAEIGNLVAIKEASGNALQVQELIRLTAGKLDVYLGDDSLTYVGMALGAKGVISVAANVVPAQMHSLAALCLAGEYERARKIQFELDPLFSDLFCEVNPIPVKKALSLLGFGNGVPRLPLTPMESEHAERLAASMRALGLID